MPYDTVGSLLTDAAARWPERPALLAPDGRSWTFVELLSDARQVAGSLQTVLSPGERVAVWAPNCPEWYLLQLGAGLAGATVVTVNPAYRAAELADVLARSRSAVIVLADEFRGTALEELLAQVRGSLPELRTAVPLRDWSAFLDSARPGALPEVGPRDPAQIQYTSGTTGAPKGAVLPHGAVAANGTAGARRWGIMPGEVWLNAMPMFHVAGSVINALGALAAGAAQLLCPFDPALVGALVQRHRPSVACLAGTMWAMLLDHGGADLSSLRLTITGGQSIPAELVRRVEAATGGRMSILFGMTELCGTITAVAPDADEMTRTQTCGLPLPGVRLRVIGPDGTVLPADGVGEIQVSGWLTMSGYFEDPDATGQTLLPDGWLRTGDIGSVDASGRLRISGRLKEMIIRGGENIYPAEIEIRLREHPAVADAAVVGIPDPLYGETVAAALVLRPGAEFPHEQELTAWCRATLAPFKTPKRWIELPTLPMTPSGKVRKFLVQEAILTATSSPGS